MTILAFFGTVLIKVTTNKNNYEILNNHDNLSLFRYSVNQSNYKQE